MDKTELDILTKEILDMFIEQEITLNEALAVLITVSSKVSEFIN